MPEQAMDILSLYRTFGKSSLSPAKGFRIRNDRFYLVKMQNTYRDQGDGYYLAPGEYVELLPGNLARERRDARLNHCNGIVEYKGPVYSFQGYYYNHEDPRPKTYHVSEEDLQNAVNNFHKFRTDWINDMIRQRDLYRSQANAEYIKDRAMKTGIGRAVMNDPDYIQETIDEYNGYAEGVQKTIDEHKDIVWRYETEKLV